MAPTGDVHSTFHTACLPGFALYTWKAGTLFERSLEARAADLQSHRTI